MLRADSLPVATTLTVASPAFRHGFPLHSFLLVFFCLVFALGGARAGEVTLAWDASEHPDVTGYELHYGPSSSDYTHSVDVGNQLQYTLRDLNDGATYYFAVRAYSADHALYSAFSNQISTTLPAAPATQPAPEPLLADFELSTSSGPAPLNVVMRDRSSGEITGRTWTIDGRDWHDSTVIAHSFNHVGNYTVALAIQGPDGMSSIRYRTIEVLPPRPVELGNPPSHSAPSRPARPAHLAANAEPFAFGHALVDHRWQRVDFDRSFDNPVVVAKSFSAFGGQPAVLRIRNVDETGFEIRVQEWAYLDGGHAEEEVTYLVMESGAHVLADGTLVEAYSMPVYATGQFEQIPLLQHYDAAPVVITAITSYDDETPVTGRVRDVQSDRFAFTLQEEEQEDNWHGDEQLSYIAWAPSTVETDDYRISVLTQTDVSSQGSILTQDAGNPDALIADMQSTNDKDTASVRWMRDEDESISVWIEEETSLDAETAHAKETVGLILLETLGG